MREAYAETCPAMPIVYDDDDITAPFRMDCILTLDEIEAAVSRRKGVSVAFYDPFASVEYPWLWLENGNRLLKIYRQLMPYDLDRLLERLERGGGDGPRCVEEVR